MNRRGGPRGGEPKVPPLTTCSMGAYVNKPPSKGGLGVSPSIFSLVLSFEKERTNI